jgi:exonuclease III
MRPLSDPPYLRIGSWNVQGLYSKSSDIRNDPSFISEIAKCDIVGLTETHTVEGDPQNPIPGFETVYFSRPKHTKAPHGSGGLAVLVKPHLRKGIKYLPSKNNDYLWMTQMHKSLVWKIKSSFA